MAPSHRRICTFSNLRFAVDDVPMRGVSTRAGPHRARVRVVGTDNLAVVTLFRGDIAAPSEAPRPRLRAVSTRYSDGDRPDAGWSDPEALTDGVYNVWVQQRHPHRGRAAMAWPSPVWVHEPQ